MWTSRSESIANKSGLRFSLYEGDEPARCEQVLRALCTNVSFRTYFNSLLASAEYLGFRWETPGLTTATLSQPFEFVLLDEPSLARRPDAEAFAEHYADAENGIATFSNLSGDALLIVPTPLTELAAYGHLAAFTRFASAAQQQALWQAVADVMVRRMSDKPVWLSTAGAGVSWLHVRIDDRPKYYVYEPYRRP